MKFNFLTEHKIWAEKPVKKSAPNDISDGGGGFDECGCGWIDYANNRHNAWLSLLFIC